MKAARV